MQKHPTIVLILIVSIVAVPFITYASLSKGFGGKILSTTIPGVTCTGVGTGPIVLIGNLVSAGSAASSSSAGGTASGVYGAVPFYASSLKKVPRAGQWILGNHQLVPNFTTCTTNTTPPIPFPVKRTTLYGVSTPQ